MAITFDQMYGTGSEHQVCPVCGYCLTCGDCESIGCGHVPARVNPSPWRRVPLVPAKSRA